MLKLSVQELEQFLTLVKNRSTEVHIGLHINHDSVKLTFMDIDGALISTELWTDSARNFAKVSSTERLTEILTRLKK